VGLTVADVERPGPVDEYPVRAGRLALQRVAVRTVAALTGSDRRRNHAAAQIDPPDGVALSVGNVGPLLRARGRDSLWAGQGGRLRPPDVARIGIPSERLIPVWYNVTINAFWASTRSPVLSTVAVVKRQSGDHQRVRSCVVYCRDHWKAMQAKHSLCNSEQMALP
jgi:hypothetical protein